MGNANGTVHNDTDKTVRILTFNYSDAFRYVHFQVYDIPPHGKQRVEAAADARGLIVATDYGTDGKHYALCNGKEVSVTTINAKGDNNPWSEEAKKALGSALEAVF